MNCIDKQVVFNIKGGATSLCFVPAKVRENLSFECAFGIQM
jgi:hypothetical protein